MLMNPKVSLILSLKPKAQSAILAYMTIENLPHNAFEVEGRCPTFQSAQWGTPCPSHSNSLPGSLPIKTKRRKDYVLLNYDWTLWRSTLSCIHSEVYKLLKHLDESDLSDFYQYLNQGEEPSDWEQRGNMRVLCQ